MKFIRRNGRIIPIREKVESKKPNETAAKALYGATGAAFLGTILAPTFKKAIIGAGFAIGLSKLAQMKSGIKKNASASEVKKHSDKYGKYMTMGALAVPAAMLAGTIGYVGYKTAPVLAKHYLIKKRIPLKNAANKVGDAIMGVHDKFLLKRPKNIDLSKGAKSFKGKYNQLSGLLGHNK